jgi:hypothetical protein
MLKRGWTQEKHTALVIGHHITQTYTNIKEEIRHHSAYKQQRVKTNRTSQVSRKWQHEIRNVKTTNNNSKCTTLTLLLKTMGGTRETHTTCVNKSRNKLNIWATRIPSKLRKDGWAVPPSYKTPTVLPIVRSNTNCVGDRGEQV